MELVDLFGLDDGRPNPPNWNLDEVARAISRDDEVRATVLGESVEQCGIGTLKLRVAGFTVGVYISYRSHNSDDETATMFPFGFPTDHRAVFYCWSRVMREKTMDDRFQVPENADEVAESILFCLSELTTHMVKIDSDHDDLTHPRRVWVDVDEQVGA